MISETMQGIMKEAEKNMNSWKFDIQDEYILQITQKQTKDKTDKIITINS